MLEYMIVRPFYKNALFVKIIGPLSVKALICKKCRLLLQGNTIGRSAMHIYDNLIFSVLLRTFVYSWSTVIQPILESGKYSLITTILAEGQLRYVRYM